MALALPAASFPLRLGQAIIRRGGDLNAALLDWVLRGHPPGVETATEIPGLTRALQERMPGVRVLETAQLPAGEGASWGRRIYLPPGPPDPYTIEHELTHAAQGRRLGPALPLVYVLADMLAGYRRNPLEREADRREERLRARMPLRWGRE